MTSQPHPALPLGSAAAGTAPAPEQPTARRSGAGGAGHLKARDGWMVFPCEHRTATALVVQWHYSQSAPNTSVARHVLIDPTGALVGASLWMPPTKAAAITVDSEWRGVLHLSRLVVAPGQPTNAASFLLGRSMKALDRDRWPTLLTYADTNLGHTGAIYKATNWDEIGPVPAGDTWVNADGQIRGRKRGAWNYSAAEMRSMGFERRPSMPKIKYVHRVRHAMSAAA